MDNSTPLTRSQVAARLGISIATVRRLEGHELHPTIGLDGVRHFAADEVEGLAATRAQQPSRTRTPSEPPALVAAVMPPVAGEVAAMVFADFDADASPTTVVINRQLTPEIVRRLHSEWIALKQLNLTTPSNSERLTSLENAVRLLEEHVASLLDERGTSPELPQDLPPVFAPLFRAR